MTIAFMPDGVRFNGHRDVQSLGEDYLGTLSEGDRLENDELNPLVYSTAAARDTALQRGEQPVAAPAVGDPERRTCLS